MKTKVKRGDMLYCLDCGGEIGVFKRGGIRIFCDACREAHKKAWKKRAHDKRAEYQERYKEKHFISGSKRSHHGKVVKYLKPSDLKDFHPFRAEDYFKCGHGNPDFEGKPLDFCDYNGRAETHQILTTRTFYK